MTIDRPRDEMIPSLRRLMREAFGDTDAFLDDFFDVAYSPDRARVAALDGEVIGALYWFDAEVDGKRLAYLYAIATAKSHRGRGVCGRLMEDTHAHLARLGYAGALLVPSEPSLFGFYARFDYAPCAPMQILTCSAGSESASLCRVSAEEYGARRKALLPRGGVWQDGVWLCFLERQSDLYAGDGFVLAARKEGDALIADELLGDLSVAPRAVRVLGCCDGRFRVAGGESFAMCRFLGDAEFAMPTYFALAFD